MEYYDFIWTPNMLTPEPDHVSPSFSIDHQDGKSILAFNDSVEETAFFSFSISDEVLPRQFRKFFHPPPQGLFPLQLVGKTLKSTLIWKPEIAMGGSCHWAAIIGPANISADEFHKTSQEVLAIDFNEKKYNIETELLIKVIEPVEGLTLIRKSLTDNMMGDALFLGLHLYGNY